MELWQKAEIDLYCILHLVLKCFLSRFLYFFYENLSWPVLKLCQKLLSNEKISSNGLRNKNMAFSKENQDECPLKASSARTKQTTCSRYVMETTWSMGLLALDILPLKCQHQQATAFAVTAVIAKVDGSVGCVSLRLVFLMSSKKTGILRVQCCYPKQIRGLGKRQILSK